MILHRVNTRDSCISQKYMCELAASNRLGVNELSITHNVQAGNRVGKLRYENIHGVNVICFSTRHWLGAEGLIKGVNSGLHGMLPKIVPELP